MKWDSDEWRKERDDLLLGWFGGDREALSLMHSLSDITELWDDLIDNDKLLTHDDINAAFYTALVVLPNNPFWCKHRLFLTPIVITAINSWQDANRLSTGTRSERALAYTLRNLDIQVVQAIVFITQGYPRLRELSAEIWTYFGANQDDIDTWLGDTT